MLNNIISLYKPGKARLNSRNIIYKMSSNENPLGASALVLKKLKIEHNKLERYPNITYLSLSRNIADIYKLKPDNIIFGNGSDEFLNLLCSVFLMFGDEVIICEHSFILYKTQILAVGAIPVIVKEIEGKINLQNIINAINTKTKLIFITLPTNPTGTFLSFREINAFIKTLKSNIILILDMAYSEYLVDDRYINEENIDCFNRSNVIIIKTFSKIHGLASLRIG